MNRPLSASDRDLDGLLAALPRAVPPPADLWPAINAAISAAPAHPARRNRLYALAAGLAVVGVAVVLAGRAVHPPVELAAVTSAVDAPRASGSVRAVEAKESEYQATRVALQRTYEERVRLLSPATRVRIAADLASIRRAQDDIRRALSADPGSRVLLRLYESTTQQEFDLYSIVGRSTEPVATRTLT
ncbi:MAG: hypothetical protein NTZ79_03345 [Proteobacteria bacterium]|nr:hypothetical protein [Pseudomonadota bacterium]